jgi:hypothetical protein
LLLIDCHWVCHKRCQELVPNVCGMSIDFARAVAGLSVQPHGFYCLLTSYCRLQRTKLNTETTPSPVPPVKVDQIELAKVEAAKDDKLYYAEKAFEDRVSLLCRFRSGGFWAYLDHHYRF